MLVLSRKATQKIRIGEDIVLTVVKVKGNSVRLGIEAPQNVRVLRGELAEWDDLSFQPTNAPASCSITCDTALADSI